MNIEEAILAIPVCRKCRRLFISCDCAADPSRAEKFDQFRQAMAEELRNAGYTVTPPGPEKLHAIPPVDLKASAIKLASPITDAMWDALMRDDVMWDEICRPAGGSSEEKPR